MNPQRDHPICFIRIRQTNNQLDSSGLSTIIFSPLIIADSDRRRREEAVRFWPRSVVKFRRQFPPTPNIRPAARHRQSTGTSGKWNIVNEPFAAETCLECLSAQTSWFWKSSSLHLVSIWRIIFVEISYWAPILMHPDWSAWKCAPIPTPRNNFEDLFKI